SDAIVWPQADIPAAGHYCFVGLIGNAADPAPSPAEFLNWDNFTRFILENNDPDAAAPTGPKGYKALKFLAPGAPDRARYMALEVLAKLPEGAKAALEAPLNLYELLRERYQLGSLSNDGRR